MWAFAAFAVILMHGWPSALGLVQALAQDHLAGMNWLGGVPGLIEDLTMSTLRSKNLFATLGTIVGVFGSAAAAASAVEAGRQPKARHLQTLGIDRDAFRSIGRI